jgi:O-antigen ligase
MMEISSTHWWESRFVSRLHALLAIALAIVLLRLAMQEDLAWLAGVAIFAGTCILTAVRWPYGALLVVLGMSAMPYFFVELFGWKVRPEHFAVVIVSGAVCFWLLLKKPAVRLHKLDYWIAAFVIINFVSSAVGSSAPGSTLRWALQNSLAVAPYFLVRLLVQDISTLRKAFRILAGVMIAECAYGIFCAFSYHVFGTEFGMSLGQYLVDVSAVYASMYEANLFGAYAGCCAVLCLALYLSGQHRIISLTGVFLAVLATVLSYSRAALVALIVASVWVFWKTRHSRGGGGSKLLALVLAFVFILNIAVYSAGGVLQKRFEDLYYEGLTEETMISRFLIAQEALMEVPDHPLLGSGTASFNLSFDWNRYIPAWASDKTWIGNAPLRVLHDTGLIGLTAFLGFFVSVWWRIRRIWKRSRVPDGLTLGLAGGLLLYAMTFQLTDGTILAFFWIHLGFLASAAILYGEPSPESASQPAALFGA